VDWDLFSRNPYTQDFVLERHDHTKIVLLVANPHAHDYSSWTRPDTGEFEFDVVIRNTGDLDNVAFKATAVSVIQEVSNLVPVIALDTTPGTNSMYREAGVLITLQDL
jgi:hypothetical protein